MSIDREEYFRVHLPPKGPTPVDTLMESLPTWRDEALEAKAAEVVETAGGCFTEALRPPWALAFDNEISRCSQASQAIAEVDVDWCSADRNRWFSEGLSQIKAERVALTIYRETLTRARKILNAQIREDGSRRKREERDAERVARAQARAAKLAENRKPYANMHCGTDSILSSLRGNVIGQARVIVNLAPDAPEPEVTEAKRRLRLAVEAHDARVEVLRAAGPPPEES